MRFLTDLARLIRGESSKVEPLPLSEPILTLPPDGARQPESATKPTRRVQDHELLQLHKAIDMAG